jgi:hypothetical protein
MFEPQNQFYKQYADSFNSLGRPDTQCFHYHGNSHTCGCTHRTRPAGSEQFLVVDWQFLEFSQQTRRTIVCYVKRFFIVGERLSVA